MKSNTIHTCLKFITAYALILCLASITPLPSVLAMENSDFILDLEAPASSSHKNEAEPPLTITANEITGPGYKAILSYDEGKNITPFTVENSSGLLNFGQIKPGEPIVRSNTLMIIPGSAPGFQTVGYIDHALRSEDKSEIPGTSCDNGNCTHIISDLWILPLTYGFGFRCDNITNTACNMTLKNTYKRFSSLETKETPAIILYSNNSNKSVVEFSHKINIPGNQTLTEYANTLFLISSPIL